MDSSWKNLQIRMEAAWNKKKVRQLQQQWNDEVTKLVTDRNKAISDVMVDILALIQMDVKSASSVLISQETAEMVWEKAYEH